MWIDVAYSILLVTAVGAMLTPLFFKQRRIEHIVFAIFCGSMAIVAIQNLTEEALGPYQHLVAMGACATCNAMWLVARALFRGDGGLSLRHYGFAGAIAGLILVNNGINLLFALEWVDSAALVWMKRSVSEITQLMSSTVLALTFWESIRGYASASKSRKQQQVLFASTMGSAVFSTTVIAHGMVPKAAFDDVFPWFVAICAFSIICVTLAILLWQQHQRHMENLAQEAHSTADKSSANLASRMSHKNMELDHTEEKRLFTRIEQLMLKDHIYLRTELKMIDIARLLDVSEYRVSRAIRTHATASNFNHFINGYRLEHAKDLLTAEDSRQWTILVISMESGFASLAPFNRAFKAQEGCTPNQYRNQQCSAALEPICL